MITQTLSSYGVIPVGLWEEIYFLVSPLSFLFSLSLSISISSFFFSLCGRTTCNWDERIKCLWMGYVLWDGCF